MSLLVRLWEKVSGTPHQYAESKMVASEVSGLRAQTRELASILASYKAKPDPFVSLIADKYQREQEANIWRGPE